MRTTMRSVTLGTLPFDCMLSSGTHAACVLSPKGIRLTAQGSRSAPWGRCQNYALYAEGACGVRKVTSPLEASRDPIRNSTGQSRRKKAGQAPAGETALLLVEQAVSKFETRGRLYFAGFFLSSFGFFLFFLSFFWLLLPLAMVCHPCGEGTVE